MTVFLTWPFKASNQATGIVTTARTLPDRLADVVNVLDYGADRTGATSSTTAFQNAIDAAFGTAGSPHGTSSWLNKPLRIPYGNYTITSPLVFTEVKGGLIVGDGLYATSITGSTSVFTFNGCEDTLISGLSTGCGGKSTVSGFHGIKLDAGSILGLKNVTLSDVACFDSQYGLRVAPGGVGGNNIVLEYCQQGACDVGLNIESTACVVTAIAGGQFGNNTGVWVQNGDFNCNMQLANVTAGMLDIQHDSTGITSVYGTRSESPNFCNITNGTLVATGFLHASDNVGYTLNITSPAVARLTSCVLGDPGEPTEAYITGTGNVFLRNVVFTTVTPIFLSSFTGKICECVTDQSFLFSQLPPAAQGLTLNLSNANTAGWGLSISGSGGNAVFTRYNGTNWTVVGV